MSGAGFLRRCLGYLRPARVQAALILAGPSLELTFNVRLPPELPVSR